MKVKCERCSAVNSATSTYCAKCSYILPLYDPAKERWRYAFFALCGIITAGLIALIFKDKLTNMAPDIAATVGGIVFFLFLVVAGILSGLLYFIPSIVAFSRKHHNAVPILLVNIFFGWTFLGWVISLIWSVTAINSSLKRL